MSVCSLLSNIVCLQIVIYKNADMLKNITLSFSLLLLSGGLTVLQSQDLNWYTIEEALELSASEPRMMVIDVYTDWCGWCKRMDAATFSDSAVAAVLGQYFYPVKLNAEGKKDIVLGDRTYKFVDNGRRGYHELAAAVTNGRLSYPTVSVLDKQGRLVNVKAGYQGPDQFSQFLEFYRTEAYKTQSWENYSAL